MASPEGFDLYQRLRPRIDVDNSLQEPPNQADIAQRPIRFSDIPGRSQLELHSELLRARFRDAARHNHSGLGLDENPIVIQEPYRELYYCRDEIRKMLEDDGLEDDARQELQLLVDFQEEHMADTIKKIDELLENDTIDFEHMWAIFVPQDVLVLPIYGLDGNPLPSYLRLRRCQSMGDRKRAWEICMERTGFDGARFGSVEVTIHYNYFPGVKKITDLFVFPLRFCQDQDMLKRTAIERGKKYEQCCIRNAGARPSMDALMLYDGPLWTSKPTTQIDDAQGFSMQKSPMHIRGQVTVNDYGLSESQPASRDILLPTLPQTVSDLSEEQLLLCPPYMPAFSLSTYTTGLVLVDKLADTVWHADALSNLKIDDNTKAILSRLFKSHASHEPSLDDIIREKGHGLVILLHGPSGSGKSRTAESISHVLRQPLLRFGPGTLREWKDELGKKLDDLSRWARRWRALMLLDEADIAFEDHDIVSVFLKVLDKHNGIVFMTGEKVDRFYKAIYSRVHIALEYPPLSRPFRQELWVEHAQKHGCTLTAEQANELARPAADKRKIRNVLYLASLTARTRGVGAEVQFSDIRSMLPLGIGRQPEGGEEGEQGGPPKVDAAGRPEMSPRGTWR